MLGIAVAMTMAFQSAENIELLHRFQTAVGCLVQKAHEANPGLVMPTPPSMVPASRAVDAVVARCETEIEAAWRAASPHYGGDASRRVGWRNALITHAVTKFYETYLR